MSQDIVFNQDRKAPSRKPEAVRYKKNMFTSSEPWRGNPFNNITNPLAKIYDYAFAYNEQTQELVYGLIMQAIFAEGHWRYCVRPDGKDAFWTKRLM